MNLRRFVSDIGAAALLAIAMAIMACFSSHASAAGASIVVFDFDAEKAPDAKWLGPALADFSINLLNRSSQAKNNRDKAIPREDLMRLARRRTMGSVAAMSMESRENILRSAGASSMIEGKLEQRRTGAIFTGTYINIDTGDIKDISFETKDFNHEKIEAKLKDKLALVDPGVKQLGYAAGAGTDNKKAFALCWEGVYLYERGDIKKAVRLLSDSAAASPKFIEPLIALGRIFAEQTDFISAEKSFRDALKASPADHRANFWLGFTYYLMADNMLAEKYLKKAIELRPENTEYAFQLGALYKKTFRHADAAKMFKASVEIDHTMADSWYELAGIFALMKKKQETLSNLEQAAKWGGPEMRKKISNDQDFKWLADDKDFKKLIRK